MSNKRQRAHNFFLQCVKEWLNTDRLLEEDEIMANNFYKWGYSAKETAVRIFENHAVFYPDQEELKS